MNEESDDDNKAKAFEFVIESQKSEVKLEKNVYERKRKWQKCERRKRERSERKLRFHDSRERKSDRNIWREQKKKAGVGKIKEIISLDNMGVTSTTEPIVNYQEDKI